MNSVPLPPRDAEEFNTVCQFCIVGCGYRVFRWPVGQNGGPSPKRNALNTNYEKQLTIMDSWLPPSSHAEVVDRDGKKFNILIIPDKQCSVNKGLSSVRGGGLAKTLYAPNQPTKDRLKMPLLKRGQSHVEITWDEGIELGSRVIKAVIDRWGPDAIGMKFFDHGGGGGGFENNWAVGRFFFSGIGTSTASIHNRPAYNSEVHAAGDAGIVPLTNSYGDAGLADTIVIVGANPYETQTNYFLNQMTPNLAGSTRPEKLRAFGEEPTESGRIIIVDPRRTMSVATAEVAGGKNRVLHLQIEPGTDIQLLNAIARVILENRWHDIGFIRRNMEWQTFEAYQRSTLAVDRPIEIVLQEASKSTGVPIDKIYQAAEWIARTKNGNFRKRTLFHYEKGLIWGLKNYENIAAIVDLGLLTGNIGKPGTGISRLGGHQEAYVRPPYPGGRPAKNVDEAVRRGEVKCYWVGGCNPVLTTLRSEAITKQIQERVNIVSRAIEQSEGQDIGNRVAKIVDGLKDGGMFLIGQDIYPTATNELANLVLPAAQWGEMNMTSINGERRLRLYPKFMDPPGESLPDWKIISKYAKKLHELYEADRNPLMSSKFLDYDWKTDEDVFIHARYQFKGTKQDPMEGYAGVTYDLLRTLGNEGIQTPTRLINKTPVGTVRMHEDGHFFTATGKARFIFAPQPWHGYAAKVSRQRRKHRFWINNGRANHIWQTLYHHQRIPYFLEHNPVPFIEINPVDAFELIVSSGDMVEIFNDMGSVEAMVYITDAVKPGHTFMLFGHPKGSVADLVSDHVDPSTTIPYYKGVWADIKKVQPAAEFTKKMTFLPRNVAS
ncbi:MAG: arsenate reductase (azurin) large subunit [Acidiferrobacteraceae bacterium]|nr:arsenate reductase (azurin) large subunit [Acidiferrobacteraceae bacterium]